MQLPRSNTVKTEYLRHLFDNTSSSYKFFWFISLVKKVMSGQVDMSFDELINEMVIEAWDYVAVDHLSLGTKDNLEVLIRYISDEGVIDSDHIEDSLRSYLVKATDPAVLNYKRILSLNVPYRLQAPFFLTVYGKEWANPTPILVEMINQEKDLIYYFTSINGLKSTIHVQSNWGDYLTQNYISVMEWTKEQLTSYLDQRNPDKSTMNEDSKHNNKRNTSSNLIGAKVWHNSLHKWGVISAVSDSTVTVSFHDGAYKFKYPDAFASILELEDESLQESVTEDSSINEFESVKKQFIKSLDMEVSYLKGTGGRKYKLFDGTLISRKRTRFIYSFDADSELHFPDDTQIRIMLPGGFQYGIIVSCEEYTILIQTSELIPGDLKSIEFTAEPWQLLVSLTDKIKDLSPSANSIAYAVACKGTYNITRTRGITLGQNRAIEHALNKPVTFIWGPPGTGKTETLARIAGQYIDDGKRVLMLSYSNVSVDGALLRVARKVENPEGRVLRYGYARMKEILDSPFLSSYQYAINQHPQASERYQELIQRKRKCRKNDPELAELNNQIKSIRKLFIEEEAELIQKAAFIATTVSKAVMDAAVNTQNFDLVLFDEASMAYIPQVVFAASLAKSSFCCLGDFKQLPAIVQCNENKELKKDIFDHVGITGAVEEEVGHEWLVMLNKQYRMHPQIAEFVSREMYNHILVSDDSALITGERIAANAPLPESPMGILDLTGLYSVCTKTGDGSRINIMSAMICARYAEILAKQWDMGIITPYNAQSRLILAMIRDIQSDYENPLKVSCATVHQFQGSEKEIVLYDAVDCFRMPYPGTLLTSMENRTADRLFNVAMTRARGKFVLLCNQDYFRRKKTSSRLMFMKALQEMKISKRKYDPEDIIGEIYTEENESSRFLITSEDESWDAYITDLQNAKKTIQIDIPGTIDDDDDLISTLTDALIAAASKGVEISIRTEEKTTLPASWKPYVKIEYYVAMPITIIDKELIWYNQPLSNADFISEGDIVETEYYPRIRFHGTYTARSITSLLEM